MRRYLRLFHGAAPAIALSAGLLAVSGVLPGASVWLTSVIADRITSGAPIAGSLAALLAVQVVQAALLVARSRITRALGWSLVHEVRSAAHRAWYSTPLDELPAVGQRLAALTHEADELQYGVSALVTAARNPVSVLVLLGSAAWMAPGLAVRFLMLAPALALPAWLGGLVVRWTTARWRADRAAWVAEVQDQHAGLATTRDLGASHVQVRRAESLSAAEAASRTRLEWVRAIPPALVQVVLALALVALILWGEAEVRAGRATVGGVVGFAVSIALLHRPLAGLVEVWALLQRSITALERVSALLEVTVQHAEPAPPPDGLAFRLRGVSVPGRLSGIDLDIPTGSKVALIGPSGSGKSTLLAVLAGHLQADGVERRPACSLRQDPWVFDRTVAENLRLAAPDATDAELRSALAEVGLQVALDRGLTDDAGERGRRYSGGERQRLCLARVMLARPDILLIDEATSELDPASARRMAERLARWEGTVVFAAHDGHFAELADRVITLDGGRVRPVGAS